MSTPRRSITSAKMAYGGVKGDRDTVQRAPRAKSVSAVLHSSRSRYVNTCGRPSEVAPAPPPPWEGEVVRPSSGISRMRAASARRARSSETTTGPLSPVPFTGATVKARPSSAANSETVCLSLSAENHNEANHQWTQPVECAKGIGVEIFPGKSSMALKRRPATATRARAGGGRPRSATAVADWHEHQRRGYQPQLLNGADEPADKLARRRVSSARPASARPSPHIRRMSYSVVDQKADAWRAEARLEWRERIYGQPRSMSGASGDDKTRTHAGWTTELRERFSSWEDGMKAANEKFFVKGAAALDTHEKPAQTLGEKQAEHAIGKVPNAQAAEQSVRPSSALGFHRSDNTNLPKSRPISARFTTTSSIRPMRPASGSRGVTSGAAAGAAVIAGATPRGARSSRKSVSIATSVDLLTSDRLAGMQKHLGYTSHSLAEQIESRQRADADKELATTMMKIAADKTLLDAEKAMLRAAIQSNEVGRGEDKNYLELDVILAKAASDRMLTADEKARLKAASKEVEKRSNAARHEVLSQDARGGQGGRLSRDSTAAAAALGPGAWRTDQKVVEYMHNVKNRPDVARKHRYQTACKDIKWIGERRQAMKQRFKDIRDVESKEVKLLVMWFQARKIQRAFGAFMWRAKAKASAETRRHKEEQASNENTSGGKIDYNAARKQMIDKMSKEVSSVSTSFQQFQAYKAANGTDILSKLK